MTEVRPENLLGDRAYDSDNLNAQLACMTFSGLSIISNQAVELYWR